MVVPPSRRVRMVCLAGTSCLDKTGMLEGSEGQQTRIHMKDYRGVATMTDDPSEFRIKFAPDQMNHVEKGDVVM